MLIAETVQPPADGQLGTWLVGFVGFLIVVDLVLKIFFHIWPREPAKGVPDLPVTHAELEAWKVQSSQFATKEQVQVLGKEVDRLDMNISKLESNTRTSIHRLADSSHSILLKVATMNERLKLLLGKNGITVTDPDTDGDLPAFREDQP